MNGLRERGEDVTEKIITGALKACVTAKLIGEHDDGTYANEIARLTVHPLNEAGKKGFVIGAVKYQGQLQVIETGGRTFTVRCMFINSKGSTTPFKDGVREGVTIDQLPKVLGDMWEVGYAERGRRHNPVVNIPHRP